MTVSPKLMMCAGIAVAGLGLIGAGAGATFTAQVAGSTSVTTGDIGLSLNGQTGRDLHLDVDGSNLGTHSHPSARIYSWRTRAPWTSPRPTSTSRPRVATEAMEQPWPARCASR